MQPTSTTTERGQWAEDLATRYLEEAGYDVLQRNYRCALGEIDIIARRGGLLVFIEVKARRNITDAAASPAPQVHLCRTIRPLMDWMSGLM